MGRITHWFFAKPEAAPTAWRVIVWWELRRIPFNIVVGVYACICLAIFLWAVTTSGHLRPGEDAIEPLALIAAPIGINVAYTLGWLVEVPIRSAFPGLSPSFGPLLLKIGLAFGLALITLPVAVWALDRILQLAGVMSWVSGRM